MLLGRILGWMIVTGYLLSVLNYVVKFVNRKWIMPMPKDAPTRVRYQTFMRFIVKNHRYLAIFTATVLLAHLYVQYQSWGVFITGFIAGGLMILQVSLGAFGFYIKKKKPGTWLYIHRTIAVLLLVAVIVHVVTVKIIMKL